MAAANVPTKAEEKSQAGTFPYGNKKKYGAGLLTKYVWFVLAWNTLKPPLESME